MPLRIYTSNRMEELVRALAWTTGRNPLRSPFEREVIVVQSRGMQRWIAMRLASTFGVWANARYPFPNRFGEEMFEAFGLVNPDPAAFSRKIMAWRIMRLLPSLCAGDPFEPLRGYLTDDPHGLKLFQLADRIADTFEQYTLFRTEMLDEWERPGEGSPGGWQPELWRALVVESAGSHRGRLRKSFMERCSRGDVPEDALPERVAVFGVSYLPPFHLDMLAALARVIEVNFFLLSPTREYWGDIVSRRRMAAMPDAERELRTEGNPLLASLGGRGREFSDLVLEFGELAELHDDLYADPGVDIHLHALQSDMLNLSGTGEDGVTHPFDPSDRSIQVHSCHSPLREVEVLHDNLLELLEKIPGLVPREILVMTPDIETYAPFITTVFGSAADGTPQLPFSIADRRLLDEGEVASSFLKILELYGSRLESGGMFDLLSSSPVRRRFDLDDEELERVRGWIEELMIRWGMDEKDRVRHGLPPYRENSWRAGLERLLLGYAMPDEGVLFEGVLPFDAMEGDAAETLGKFASFVDAVDRFVATVDRPRTLVEWRVFLLATLDGFLASGEGSEREFASVHETIDSLSAIAADSGFDGSVTAKVIITWLRESLEKAEQGLGFMTGGITFCEMLPMRSIPFRVVAMIGMNDSAFPEQDRPAGFDLMAKAPRPGDRSRRADGRYLFLESILSARDILYISYVGQSVRDNGMMPPSVLVTELLDAIRRGFSHAGAEDPADLVVTGHRLQGFHPDYFSPGTGYFSYSAENCRAIDRAASGASASPPFIDGAISPPPEEMSSVTIERLCRFFANPAAFFLEERLGMRSGAPTVPLDDREPFDISGLDAYLLRQELLESLLGGDEPRRLLPLFRSRGLLPPSLHGQRAFDGLLEDVEAFAEKVRQEGCPSGRCEPVPVDLAIGRFRLTGALDRVSSAGQFFYRCASMKERDRIRAWIFHLVLNTLPDEGRPRDTVLVMRDGSCRFRPVEEADLLLGKFLDRYWEGLSMPLSFFPRSSTAWAEAAGKEAGERLDAALAAWETRWEAYPGENDDPAFRRCFGLEAPFGEAFGVIADELLRPMLEHGGAS